MSAPPNDRRTRPGSARLALALLAVLLAGLFVWGAQRNSRQVNTDPRKSDQGSYLEYAIRLAETDRRWVGNRNQMPLVPMLLSFFYRPGMSEAEFFEIGKRVHIALALLASLVVGWIGARFLPGRAALHFTLIATFCHLIFRAPYFKAEVLYYLLSFLAFLTGLRAVRAPGIRAGLGFGALCATTHLCKASTQPLLAAFAGVLAVRIIFALCARDSTGNGVGRWRAAADPCICVLAALTAFVVLLAPYLLNSKRVYGRYFYNVNSTFYVWYDSWQEVKRGTRAAGDRVGWPKLPPDQIPSARKYLREHTPGQIVARMGRGLARQWTNLVGAHGSFKYLALAFGTAGFLAWRHRSGLAEWARPHRWGLLFAAGYVALGYLGVAWYSVLADGSRFVMAFYLPLLFGGFWLVTRLPETTVRICGRNWPVAGTFQRLVAALLACEIPFNLVVRLADEFGGA